MNAEYQEKLLMKVVMRFGGKLLIPAPVRAVWTGVRSLKYLQQGIASLKKADWKWRLWMPLRSVFPSCAEI